MRIFLSWSGDRSRAAAEALREWLPLVLQYAKPFLSGRDISAGGRWAEEIGRQLAESNFGIIVLTSDNLLEPWILFEAGALSNAFARSAVCPYLVDVDSKDLTGPLSHFMAKKCDRRSTLDLVQAVNTSAPQPLGGEHLEKVFDALWPRLEAKLRNLPAPGTPDRKPRSEADVLEELVESVRSMSSLIRGLGGHVVRLGRQVDRIESEIGGSPRLRDMIRSPASGLELLASASSDPPSPASPPAPGPSWAPPPIQNVDDQEAKG